MAVSEKDINFYKKILVEESSHQLKGPKYALQNDSFNEVFENCFLGDAEIAIDKYKLKEMGITHLLNACQGEKFSQVDTNQNFYDEVNIKFFGCNLMDFESSKIENFFDEASDFISEALDNRKGKILVHCYMGISRSSSFIIAYLIKYRKYKLEEALRTLRRQRYILPNDGFLAQLIKWEKKFVNQIM